MFNAAVAWADHGGPLRDAPMSPRRAVLTDPPERVALWFNERIEAAYSSLSVATEAGVRVDRDDVTVGPEDPRKLSVTLPALEPGRYVARFRVLSVDGHVVQSSFAFTVK